MFGLRNRRKVRNIVETGNLGIIVFDLNSKTCYRDSERGFEKLTGEDYEDRLNCYLLGHSKRSSKVYMDAKKGRQTKRDYYVVIGCIETCVRSPILKS